MTSSAADGGSGLRSTGRLAEEPLPSRPRGGAAASTRRPWVDAAPGSSELWPWVRAEQDNLLDLLRRLICARSENPPGDETEVASVASAALAAIGAEVSRIAAHPRRPNVVGLVRSGRPGPTVLCNAHLDTVPAGPGWSVDPFAGVVRDGRLYGRGACDHKFAVAALVYAVKALQAADRLRGELMLIFDADEEQGGHLGMRVVLDELRPQVDMALYAAPTGYDEEGASFFACGTDNVLSGSAGRLRFRLTVDSKVAYQVAPVISWYPAEIAGKLVEPLQSLLPQPPWCGPNPRTRLVGSAGGSQEWEVLVLPGETESMLMEAIERHCAVLTDRYGALCSLEQLEFVAPAETPAGHTLVRALVEGAHAATGRLPHVGPICAVTGMSPIQEALGVPIASFGFGRIDLCHTPDEWIEVEQVLSSTVAYAECLARVSAGAEGERA